MIIRTHISLRYLVRCFGFVGLVGLFGLFGFSSLLFIGCGEVAVEEDTRQYSYSSIKPAPTLVPDVQLVTGARPLNGQGVSVSQNSEFTWEKPIGVIHQTVVLMSAKPRWANDHVSGFENLQDVCLGGTSSLAGDDLRSSVLFQIDSESEIFTCDFSSNNGLISVKSKRQDSDVLSLGSGDFSSGSTIYWAILGYDANYRITHSSSVHSLILED